MSKQEHAKKALELNSSTVRSRLAELESTHQNHETENAQLRRDKMLLVDHVADLQKKVSGTCVHLVINENDFTKLYVPYMRVEMNKIHLIRKVKINIFFTKLCRFTQCKLFYVYSLMKRTVNTLRSKHIPIILKYVLKILNT